MIHATSLIDRPPPVEIMGMLGLDPDPWQLEVLENRHPQLLLNCSRQSGKTTVVAVQALFEALFKRFARVLIVSKSHRQSKEVLLLLSARAGALTRRHQPDGEQTGSRLSATTPYSWGTSK